jgi:hypothetical protein
MSEPADNPKTLKDLMNYIYTHYAPIIVRDGVKFTEYIASSTKGGSQRSEEAIQTRNCETRNEIVKPESLVQPENPS